ncbi:hypothetical protein EHM76_00150 [bacterium]|nr:MAG: hypothetical protein EHM76_00150 [bacterium]
MSALDRIAKVLAGRVGGPHPGGIHTYHASPHDFDRFDWSKIGSGEGGGVFGKGFYSAENPKVSGQGGQYWGAFLDRFSPTEIDASVALRNNRFSRTEAIHAVQQQIERYKQLGAATFKNEIAQKQKTLALLESDQPRIGPRTYELDLKVKPEELLDWDKSIGGQNAYERLRSHWDQKIGDPDIVSQRIGVAPEAPGGRLISAIGGLTQDSAATTNMLREAGIPGIRYLDQGSRLTSRNTLDHRITGLETQLAEARDPGRRAMLAQQMRDLENARNVSQTYNYVITDPSKIDILAKYGIVGGAGLGALAAGTDRAQAEQPASFNDRWMGAVAAQDQYGARQ